MTSKTVADDNKATSSVFELFGTDMVTIKVGTGSESKTFLIHKKLMCERVDYFHKMFEGKFEEATKNHATFPDDALDAWSILVEWLYRDVSLPMPFTLKPNSQQEEEWYPLFQAVGLAEKYCIFSLVNLLMDTILGFYGDDIPSCHAIKSGYAATAPGSRLRLYLARYCAYDVCYDGRVEDWEISSLIAEYPELASDIIPWIRNTVAKGLTSWSLVRKKYTRCSYHHHSNGALCPTAT